MADRWEYKVMCHHSSGWNTASVVMSRQQARDMKRSLLQLADTRRVSVIRRRVGKWENYYNG
jgi:lipoate-protein ligase A